MATVSLLIRDQGTSSDRVDVWQSPVFFGIDDAGGSADQAFLGRYAVVGATDVGTDLDAAAVGLRVSVVFAETLEPDEDRVALVAKIAPVVSLAMTDAGDDADTLAVRGAVALTAISRNDDADDLNLGNAEIPILAAPLPGEVPGAVNIVENPSAEYALTGWSGASGATLARVSADPWVGGYAGQATIAAGVSVAEVIVSSAVGLADALAAAWIGSLAVRGDALDVRPFLRFTYSDASTSGAYAGGYDRLWLPSDLGAALTGWWYAPDIAQADGSVVASWVSRSGGHTLVQATGGVQPVYETGIINTRPVVRFTAASSHRLEIATTLGIAAQPFSVYAAWNMANANSQCLITFDGTANDPAVAIDASGNLSTYAGTGLAGAITKGAWRMTGHGFQSATSWRVIDGNARSTGNAGTTAPNGTKTTVGSVIAENAQFLNGDVYTIVVTSDAVTQANEDRLFGWMAHDLALAGNLPGGHPYGAAAPIVADAGPAAPVAWARFVTDVGVPDPTKTLSRVDLVVQVPRTGSTQLLYVDGAQIEDATAGGATGYVDGDQGDGYAWAGPQHASMSYREPMP